MNCPDCGRPMRDRGKDTSSGREVREYHCGHCGLVAYVDEGVAWWRIISSESTVDYEKEEASAQSDGPRILKIIRSDGLKDDAIRASVAAKLGAQGDKAPAPASKAGERRRPRRGTAILVAVFALLALISMFVWTQTSWAAATLNLLGSFAGSYFWSR